MGLSKVVTQKRSETLSDVAHGLYVGISMCVQVIPIPTLAPFLPPTKTSVETGISVRSGGHSLMEEPDEAETERETLTEVVWQQ